MSRKAIMVSEKTHRLFNIRAAEEDMTHDELLGLFLKRDITIPTILTRLTNSIFDVLPESEARAWHTRFIQALPINANLSFVWPKFIVWLLIDEQDGVLQYAKKEESITAIKRVAELYQKLIDGETVGKQTWKDVADSSGNIPLYAPAYFDTIDAIAAYAHSPAFLSAYIYSADISSRSPIYVFDSIFTAASAYAYANFGTNTSIEDGRHTYYTKCADKLMEILKDLKKDI